jgi:hypothetical protein
MRADAIRPYSPPQSLFSNPRPAPSHREGGGSIFVYSCVFLSSSDLCCKASRSFFVSEVVDGFNPRQNGCKPCAPCPVGPGLRPAPSLFAFTAIGQFFHAFTAIGQFFHAFTAKGSVFMRSLPRAVSSCFHCWMPSHRLCKGGRCPPIQPAMRVW